MASLPLFVAVCKELERQHGNRLVSHEALNEIILRLDQMERTFKTLPLVEKKQRARKCKLKNGE